MAISLFLCALERVLEMTTIQLHAFLDAPHEVVHDVLVYIQTEEWLSSPP